MVRAVEVDTDKPLRPTHVDAGEQATKFVEYRNLRLWRGESGLNKEQASQRLIRGFGSSVYQSQHLPELNQTTNTGVSLSDCLHVMDLHIGRVHQGIDPLHAHFQLQTATEIEGGTRSRCHHHAVDRLCLA